MDSRAVVEVLFHLRSGDLGQGLWGIGTSGNSEGEVINLILDQVGHYKNWREWSHTVHNLDKGEGSRRREDGRREDYSRDHR